MIEQIDNFIRTNGVKETRFGLEAIGDGNLVWQLRYGRKLKPSTEQRIRKYMERKSKECQK